MSIEAVADHLDVSVSKVSRIETAQRSASVPDVMALCRLYAVGDVIKEHLIELARRSREDKPWWHEFKSYVNPEYARYVGLEDVADTLLEYKIDVVPGLLQTREYCKAIIQSVRTETSQDVDLLVRIRTRRQEVLSKERPPNLTVVLDEGVLYRIVGGPGVMREQLSHLAAQGERENISIRVLPFAVGAHPALGSTFTILRVSNEKVADVVYLEGSQQAFLNDPTSVLRFTRIFERVSDLALPPSESGETIRHAAEKLDAPS